MNLLLYGLQRSGTNYLEALLTKNYRVQFLNSTKDRSSPLHKHCRLYREKEIIPEPQYDNKIEIETFEQFQSLFHPTPDYYLVVSKDPYSWYQSYRAWAEKCSWPDVSHHYIEEYNLFYKTFIELSSRSDKFIFVRYVDLIDDAGAALEELEKKMRLKKRLLAHLKLRNPGNISQSAAFSESKRAYYLNREYLNEYSEEEMKTLNERLDPQVISALGYESRGPRNQV